MLNPNLNLAYPHSAIACLAACSRMKNINKGCLLSGNACLTMSKAAILSDGCDAKSLRRGVEKCGMLAVCVLGGGQCLELHPRGCYRHVTVTSSIATSKARRRVRV